MKRFKAALPCGSWSKEDLVEEENGAFVKYTDVQALVSECMEWNWGEEEREHIPTHVREKFEEIAFGD